MAFGQLVSPDTTVRRVRKLKARVPPFFGTIGRTHENGLMPIARFRVTILILDGNMIHGNIVKTLTARFLPRGVRYGTTRGSGAFVSVVHVQGHTSIYDQKRTKVHTPMCVSYLHRAQETINKDPDSAPLRTYLA